MIDKVTHIKSVSRFKNFSSLDDVLSLAQATLIYAPNGRGKTSLSATIQSFIQNDPDLINIHKSKVYPGEPEISLKYNKSETAIFSSGTWDKQMSDITALIYDRSFIYHNIHTEAFEHDHKKNLYRLLAIGNDASEAIDAVVKKRSAKES